MSELIRKGDEKIGIYNIEKSQIDEMIKIFHESFDKKIEYAANLCVDPSKNLNIDIQNLCIGTEYKCNISDECKKDFILIGDYHTHVSEDGEDIPSILDLKSLVENGYSVECIGAKNKIKCYTRKDMSVKLPMFLVRLDIEVRRAFDKLINIDKERPEDFPKEHINIVRKILEKHFIETLIYSKEESKLSGKDIFDITTTGMSSYDVMLGKGNIVGKYKNDPVGYFRDNKGLVFEIVWMSPEEYMMLSYTIHNIEDRYGDIKFDEYVRETVNMYLVEMYKERVLKGSKMPIPVLDYSNMSQEGRHRSVVAMELEVEKIPVLVIRTYEE